MKMHEAKILYCHEQDSLRRSCAPAQTARLVHKKFIPAIILIASEEIQVNSCAHEGIFGRVLICFELF